MITRKTKKTEVIQKAKIDCKSCTHCCEYGSGIVLTDEVKNLASGFGIDEIKFIEKYLDEFKNFNTTHYKFKTIKSKPTKPYGKCIFLDKKGCTIHNIKPLHCKVGNCTEIGEDINIWFTLNHFVDPYDPESIREWAQYIKLGNKIIDGGKLEDLVADKKKLKKILNYEILQ